MKTLLKQILEEWECTKQKIKQKKIENRRIIPFRAFPNYGILEIDPNIRRTTRNTWSISRPAAAMIKILIENYPSPVDISNLAHRLYLTYRELESTIGHINIILERNTIFSIQKNTISDQIILSDRPDLIDFSEPFQYPPSRANIERITREVVQEACEGMERILTEGQEPEGRQITIDRISGDSVTTCRSRDDIPYPLPSLNNLST